MSSKVKTANMKSQARENRCGGLHVTANADNSCSRPREYDGLSLDERDGAQHWQSLACVTMANAHIKHVSVYRRTLASESRRAFLRLSSHSANRINPPEMTIEMLG